MRRQRCEESSDDENEEEEEENEGRGRGGAEERSKEREKERDTHTMEGSVATRKVRAKRFVECFMESFRIVDFLSLPVELCSAGLDRKSVV